jgi:hypothetical protein
MAVNAFMYDKPLLYLGVLHHGSPTMDGKCLENSHLY